MTGLFWLAAWQITREWPSVQARTVEAMEQFRQYLVNGPLGFTEGQIDGFLDQAWTFIQAQAELLLSGALAIGTTLGHFVAGALLALFILLCILADGGGIWRWTVRLFPQRARPAVDGAGRAGWVTVINYARTQLLVATIDATGIALGAWILQVPLPIPIGVLVFLGSFVPIVGAVVTGTLAVFLALVYNGPWTALWMLIVVLGVQQLEGHVLQPLLMGSAVKVHPLAVVLVVAGGAMIAGIPGALFAVPLAAFINVVAVYLANRVMAVRASARPQPTSSGAPSRVRGGNPREHPVVHVASPEGRRPDPRRLRGCRGDPRGSHRPHAARPLAAPVRGARRSRST